MAYHLVVTRPFGGRERGDVISDPAEMAAVLADENEHSVVKVTVPDAAPPREGN